MKKIIIFIIIFLTLASLGFLSYKLFFKKKTPEPVRAVISKRQELVNQLALEKRPYVTITPREDGKEISMTIFGLKNSEEKAEYELEYQAGTMIQSAVGKINFLEEKPPVTKKLLLGSCSAGGKCSYDKDVSGGSLALYFDGAESYGLRGDFTYNKMSEKVGLFSSRDVKVSLDIGSKGLAKDAFLIVASTMGLPGEVSGKVLIGPVGFFTSSNPNLSQAALTFKSHEDLSQAKIMGWTGSSWKEYAGKVGEGDISTSVDQLSTFILVNPQ